MNAGEWRRGGRYQRCGEFDIFYRDAGSGDALLCIHGFPTASWDWHRIWPELTGRFRVIAPDLLGFGFSDKPVGHAYSVVEQATLLEALLSAVGIRAAHVLAHDYGVTVAQELLARQSEQPVRSGNGFAVRSVTLLNGGLFPEATHPLFIQKALKNRMAGPVIARLMSEAMFRRSFPRVFGAAHRPSDAELREFWSLIAYNDGLRVAPRETPRETLDAVLTFLGVAGDQ